MASKRSSIRNPRSNLTQNTLLQLTTKWPKIARSKARRTAARVRAQGEKKVTMETDNFAPRVAFAKEVVREQEEKNVLDQESASQ